MNPKFVRDFAVMAVAALSGIAGSAMFSPKSGQAPIHSPTPAITANPLIGEWEVIDAFLLKKSAPPELLPTLRVQFTERFMVNSPCLAYQANMTFTELMAVSEGRLNKRVENAFVVDAIGWTAVYQVDPTKEPQENDLLLTHDLKKEFVQGIYKIDGDTATLSLGQRHRPLDFHTGGRKRSSS